MRNAGRGDRLSGHRSSVVDGVTGVLCSLDRLGDTIADVLARRRTCRAALAAAALARARTLTWDASAAASRRAPQSDPLNEPIRRGQQFGGDLQQSQHALFGDRAVLRTPGPQLSRRDVRRNQS